MKNYFLSFNYKFQIAQASTSIIPRREGPPAATAVTVNEYGNTIKTLDANITADDIQRTQSELAHMIRQQNQVNGPVYVTIIFYTEIQ